MPDTIADTDALLGSLRAQFSHSALGFLRRQIEVLAGLSPDLLPLLNTLEELLDGGKRLRPTFAYWGWRSSGGAPDGPIITAAASLEFLQAGALIHDDVMDGSDTRRGKPAAHRRLAELHHSQGYLGSSEDFGVGSAILLGDLCLSWSDEMLTSSGLDPAAVQAARPYFDEMRTEVMAGQYLDLLEQVQGRYDLERALRVARLKTAKYTVERPLHIGAAAAGADPAHLRELTAYAIPLGEAFQLRDDMLGVFGDPAETGKPAGDDLREGKRTALVAIAWTKADARQQDLLRSHLGDPTITPALIDDLRTVITETGAPEAVEAMIVQRATESAAAIDSMTLDDTTRAAFARLLVLASHRSA
ncbi:MAG TPA: polyprenyl synthetase family protein [Actinomycetota bacterium]|nr:polyprenyl synthetase family protein [Actinomycetota bacterium]